jgi:hypothetical protein
MENVIDRLFGTADKLVGDEGLKTDVNIRLDTSVYLNLIGTILVAIMLGHVAGILIKSLFPK